MDYAFALHIDEIGLEEELPCFVGSLDLERFQLSLFETFRTCLALGHGVSSEPETYQHPHTGSAGLGEADVPAAGRCGS